MYYHLNDHIYVTRFRDEFIVLDTKKDKYTIYLKQLSELLSTVFENKISSKNKSIVKKLLDDNVIVAKETPYPFYLSMITSTGVSNADWRLPLNTKKIKINLTVLNALFSLIKINFYIKAKGLYSAIHLIKRSKKNQSKYTVPQEEDLINLANIVNKACLIYPTRTKCLEWAMTFVLLALKRKWKCNLEIGVQNYPFFAHAWVECAGKVVMDSQDLRQGLAVILNEPFRKLKI